MSDLYELKKQLHQACLELILQRIENAEESLQSAREAAHEETKSSAGDKYETGRAMMQQEQQKHERQLFEAQKLKNELLVIDPNRPCEKVEPGSFIDTNQGKFFISIGLGKIKSGGVEVYAVSLASPVGKALVGKQAGEKVIFQGREYQIRELV